jgi:U2 small nuclear ribonucleoprotein A'
LPEKDRSLHLHRKEEPVDTLFFCVSLGHKIPAIENLGAARDQECIDFTDNDISVLTNFPQSPRLQTLLCARNRIQRIEKNVTKSVPALSTLVLTQNSVSELADLEVLRGFEKLTFLSLVDNPVANKEVCIQ